MDNPVEVTSAAVIKYLREQRRISLDGMLTREMLEAKWGQMVELDFKSDEPITILIASRGGDCEATLQFSDMIASLNSPVDGIAIGDCCSMAVDLLQLTRRRMILPSTRMLLHFIRHGREWIGDDLEKLDADLAFFRQEMTYLREQRYALYEKRTGLSHERLDKIFRYGEMHVAYLSARQVIEFNLADEILRDFKIFPDRVYEKPLANP